ncbi:NAD-dependent epimerase/dehydratase family protein [Candidatus Berkiella aquae]|uniref:NAD-dependent epimerase/dehydratase family protein n=1 Tax=Candidatus Berkiella aquae TaxID=295108 RepID=A0A0Q9YPQ9_9GAMM|nr:NAD-dependent epimerase/dehydratase family protein [Candidatus Berkiella aquae]MCS5710395.1 NAD-dependent epimerase/dehydratase family protein [Candidatus Berkiella aquae]
MAILIMGATGFIGKNLVRFLSENGHHVYGFVHQIEQNQPSQAQLKTLAPWLPPDRILAGDLTKETLSTQWLQKNQIDTVIYAAGQPDVKKAQAEYGRCLYWGHTPTYQINANGAKKVADVCEEAGLAANRTIRFIYLSSIYAGKIIPTSNLQHKSCEHYHFSKWHAQELLKQNKTLAVDIIRLPRMIGPYQNTNAFLARLRDKIFMGTKLDLNDQKMDITPIEALNQLIEKRLNTEVTSYYQLLDLTTNAFEVTSQEMGHLYDELIAERNQTQLLWGQKSLAGPTLRGLAQDIVNIRGVEMDAAATVIQQHIRGYLARKNG